MRGVFPPAAGASLHAEAFLFTYSRREGRHGKVSPSPSGCSPAPLWESPSRIADFQYPFDGALLPFPPWKHLPFRGAEQMDIPPFEAVGCRQEESPFKLPLRLPLLALFEPFFNFLSPLLGTPPWHSLGFSSSLPTKQTFSFFPFSYSSPPSFLVFSY